MHATLSITSNSSCGHNTKCGRCTNRSRRRPRQTTRKTCHHLNSRRVAEQNAVKTKLPDAIYDSFAHLTRRPTSNDQERNVLVERCQAQCRSRLRHEFQSHDERTVLVELCRAQCRNKRSRTPHQRLREPSGSREPAGASCLDHHHSCPTRHAKTARGVFTPVDEGVCRSGCVCIPEKPVE